MRRVIVPRLDREDWEGYVDWLREIGAQIESAVADAAGELRKRALHCSFADCDFADSVLAFLMYLECMVEKAIADRNWVSLPAEADFSWGALIAT